MPLVAPSKDLLLGRPHRGPSAFQCRQRAADASLDGGVLRDRSLSRVCSLSTPPRARWPCASQVAGGEKEAAPCRRAGCANKGQGLHIRRGARGVAPRGGCGAAGRCGAWSNASRWRRTLATGKPAVSARLYPRGTERRGEGVVATSFSHAHARMPSELRFGANIVLQDLGP